MTFRSGSALWALIVVCILLLSGFSGAVHAKLSKVENIEDEVVVVDDVGEEFGWRNGMMGEHRYDSRKRFSSQAEQWSVPLAPLEAPQKPRTRDAVREAGRNTVDFLIANRALSIGLILGVYLMYQCFQISTSLANLENSPQNKSSIQSVDSPEPGSTPTLESIANQSSLRAATPPLVTPTPPTQPTPVSSAPSTPPTPARQQQSGQLVSSHSSLENLFLWRAVKALGSGTWYICSKVASGTKTALDSIWNCFKRSGKQTTSSPSTDEASSVGSNLGAAEYQSTPVSPPTKGVNQLNSQ